MWHASLSPENTTYFLQKRLNASWLLKMHVDVDLKRKNNHKREPVGERFEVCALNKYWCNTAA